MFGSEYSRPLPPTLRVGIYVRVVSNDDEWEDLIGIVDEFLDCNLEEIDSFVEDCLCLVYFPVSRSSQERCNLAGVNDYPGTVIAELKRSEFRKVFDIKALEEVNPEHI